jgi:hypothetical protein
MGPAARALATSLQDHGVKVEWATGSVGLGCRGLGDSDIPDGRARRSCQCTSWNRARAGEPAAGPSCNGSARSSTWLDPPPPLTDPCVRALLGLLG